MDAFVDPSGRIELPGVLRDQLGLKSGDRVVIEEENGCLVIKPVGAENPLRWEGNVLVHNGVLLPGASDVLDEIRHERHSSCFQK
jgi:AbrB family looped-hinge helix DNA binding protein